MELVTGHVAGNADWDLPFKGEGLLGIIQGKDGDLSGSRLAHIMKVAVPYSLGSLTQPDGLEKMPFGAIGSVSKGASMTSLTAEYVRVLKTVSETKSWTNLKNSKTARAAVAAYAPRLMEAAIANGYSPDAVINGARRGVLGDLYAEFLQAFEKGQDKKMERIAGEILRATGSFRGLKDSMITKNSLYTSSPYRLTPEQLKTIEEAFK
jgi:hypothetical protein